MLAKKSPGRKRSGREVTEGGLTGAAARELERPRDAGIITRSDKEWVDARASAIFVRKQTPLDYPLALSDMRESRAAQPTKPPKPKPPPPRPPRPPAPPPALNEPLKSSRRLVAVIRNEQGAESICSEGRGALVNFPVLP
jgi:hypothetical protein